MSLQLSQTSCSVLVVEDDPVSADALSLLLKHFGCTVRAVGSVEQALRELGDQTHIIMDLMLPGRPGVELLKQIRLRRHRAHVAVVTALGRDTPVVRTVAAFEPEVILQKPIDFDILLNWLQETLP